jgi:UDP-glucose 4-epimerase
VAKVAKEVGAKMFFASSSEVYGKAAIAPMSEVDDLRVSNEPRWDYAHSKLVGERYIRNILPEDQYVIGRFFNVVGPGQYPESGMVLPRFIDQAIKNEYLTVYGSGKAVRCFGYVGEIVKAMVELMDGHGGVYNICGTERLGIADLAKRVVDVLASNSEIVRTLDAPEDADYRTGHTFKLRETLGWVPNMSIERIIQLTAGWWLKCMESRS